MINDQYPYVNLSSVSPQSKFLESYPEPPLATSTLYLNKYKTTDPDGSNHYQLVGVHIVLKKDAPKELWRFLASVIRDRATNTIDLLLKEAVKKSSLQIYCDTLEVYGEFSVPEVDVSIFARRIIWATSDATINTSPLRWRSKAQDSDGTNLAKDGSHGRNAGNLNVFVSEVVNPFTVEGSVTIYGDRDYKGQSKVLSVGTYDISELGIGNDSLSSLRVPKGLQVTLYEHSGFQGRFKTLTGDASYIDDFNNITSSIKVEPLKRFIANGGNGQDAGNGRNATPQTIVDMESKVSDEIKLRDSYSVANFDPPATYYEHIGFITELDGNTRDKNYNKQLSNSQMSFYRKMNGGGSWGDNSKWPSPGVNPIAPGNPGNAGNGGTLKSNFELLEFFMNSPGQGGLKAKDCKGVRPGNPIKCAKYQVHILLPPTIFASKHNRSNKVFTLETIDNSATGKDAVAPEAKVRIGNSPVPSIINESNAWVHPLSLQKAIEYARDLFLSNSRTEVQNFLTPYHQALSLDIPTQAGAWENSNNAQWISAQSEISTMLLRLSSHLDYFGNPGGFSPFLSLSSTIKSYEDETQRALKALILSHWITKEAQIIEEQSKALQESISVLNKDTQDATKQILQTEQKIDSTINSINSLSQQLEDKADKLDRLKDTLLKQAEHDIDQQHQIKFSIKLCAAICQVIPVGQPVLGSVATLASVASNLIGSNLDEPVDLSEIKDAFEKCQGSYQQYKEVAEKAKKEKDSPASENEEEAKKKESVWATVGKGVGPALSQVSEAFSSLKVPQSEVDAELNQLIIKNDEWKEIVKEIKDLNAMKSKLITDLEQFLLVLGENNARITSNASATVNMHQEIAKKNLSLDLEVVGFVNQMNHRAKLRLIYSLYLLVKSYETRVLKPISVDWTLSEVTKKIIEITESKFDINSLDNWVSLLNSIFNENLQKIRDSLKADFQVNEMKDPLRYVFTIDQTPDILSQLNETGQTVFNALPLILPTDQQCFISNIELTEVEFDSNSPQISNSQNIKFYLIPGKIGILRRDKNLYSIYTNEPLMWTFTYSSQDGIEPGERIPISEDILNWLVSDPENLIKQKLTLPPMWTDIKIRVVSSQPLKALPNIVKLNFKFYYVSAPAPQDQTVLNVQTIGSSKGVIIECSEDLAGRKNGFDQMIRIYQSGTTVSLAVPPKTEDSYFKQWNLVGWKSQTKQEASFNFEIKDNTIAQCCWSTEPKALAFVMLQEGTTASTLPKTENLPLYLTASTEATILTIISNPDDAEVIEESEEGWQQINYKGIVGWIKR